MSVLIKKITQRHSYGAIIIQEFNKIGLLAHEIWEGIEEFFFDYNNEGTLINMRIMCPDGKTDDVKIVDSKERSILPPDEYKYDEQGRIIEKKSYLPGLRWSADNPLLEENIERYSNYDEYGNWLHSDLYGLNKDGKEYFYSSCNREIEYY